MSYLKAARVVVTGMGIVAPNAIGKSDFWASLSRGHSGTKRITLFDPSSYRSHIAGEVSDFDLRRYLEPQTKISRMGRQAQFALAAASMAQKDAELSDSSVSLRSVIPVCMGVGNAAVERIEQGMERMQKRGPLRVSTSVVESSSPQQAASLVGQELGFSTSAQTFSSACAAGLQAIGHAAHAIRSGQTDMVVAGGADAPISKLSFACFDRSGLASARNDSPETASRPFDRDCDSGVIAEGSAVFVLENLDCAMARGVHIYAEILGISSQSDSTELGTMSGLVGAMQMALANSHMLPSNIDFISAHGPGHPLIDRLETDMIKQVYGADAYRIPVTSVKGNIGNPLAAAGPLQIASCALAFDNGIVPHIANHDNPAEGCDLDYVKGSGRLTNPKTVMINSHGLGGGNTSMIVQKVDVQ